jgi:excisionase family DNA binding protein
MEKICIANLRQRMAYPGHRDEVFGREKRSEEARRPTECSFAASDGNGSADGKAASAEDGTVSLLLTREQMSTLRSNRRLASSLIQEHAEGSATMLQHRDEPIVIKFEFESISPVRLLKVEEVMQMLRISKSSLNKIIREGTLKSYRFGRLRRIMLADILSYLEDHRELAVNPPQAPKPSPALVMQQSQKKEV